MTATLYEFETEYAMNGEWHVWRTLFLDTEDRDDDAILLEAARWAERFAASSPTPTSRTVHVRVADYYTADADGTTHNSVYRFLGRVDWRSALQAERVEVDD